MVSRERPAIMSVSVASPQEFRETKAKTQFDDGFPPTPRAHQ
ncbi:uncharacterized protein G2W53_036121 [Senna tora]|uniref:Uncharacterized protein n=1 Tax=Senna tora TaxID=362788 RepID=A0A834SS07_9FABA|nr:uncharacterized protein G2W53_036121 [Senna tora]